MIGNEDHLIIDMIEILISLKTNQIKFKVKKLIVMEENFKIITIEIILDNKRVIKMDRDFSMTMLEVIKIDRKLISTL